MRSLKHSVLWHDISESLRARRSRTLLSLAALSLGMICLSMLASILGGLNQRAARLAAELGAQVIAVHDGGAGLLSEEQAQSCRRSLPGVRVDTLTRYRVVSGNLNHPLMAAATGEDLARIKQWPLAAGRFLDRADLRQKSRHCVISASLQQRHQLTPGSMVLLERIPFKVVGILGRQGSGDAPNQANGQADLYIPRTVAPTWSHQSQQPKVDTLYVQWPEGGYDQGLQALKNVLYADPQARNNTLQFITPDILLAGIRRVQLTLRLTVGTVAVLSLVLGGCTLMALMIATVKERVSEIGLRFSLGASRQAIYQLFIGEALCITACAALVGSLVGHITLLSLRRYIQLPFHPTWQSIALPGLAALILAGLFAFWPAWQAAQIRPADALRCE